MSALTDFLLARIAEDEAVARRAAQEFEGVGVSTPPTWGRRQWEFRVDRRNPALVDHIVAYSPARVLAECEAKRRIVEREVNSRTKITYRRMMVLQDLAAIWSDHPDFDPGWAL